MKLKLPPIYGYVVWLLLSDKSSREIKNWMKLLRDKTDSPFFVPHLTLLRPSDQLDEQQIIRATEKIAEGQKLLRLHVTGTDSGSSQYQAFYLKVEPSQALTALHAKLEKTMSDPGNKAFNPHVSLVYGSLPANKRTELEKVIQLPEQYQMTGNRLAVVRLNGTPEHWSIVHQSKLEEKPA